MFTSVLIELGLKIYIYCSHRYTFSLEHKNNNIQHSSTLPFVKLQHINEHNSENISLVATFILLVVLMQNGRVLKMPTIAMK